MKIKFLSSLLFLVFFNFSYSQTKEETISWLNEKFKSPQQYEEALWTSSRTFEISYDGNFIVTQYSNYSTGRAKTTYRGNFKNLALNSTTATKVKSYFYIIAECYNNNACITQTSYKPDGSLEATYSSSRIFFIPVNQREVGNLEERAPKAFNHLIKIFGGKKEVF